jgi:alkylation response protein AidB-like acyl-CoA dehydrogenase
MTVDKMSDAEFFDLCARVRGFVDDRVIPLEPVLDRGDNESVREMKALQEEARSRGLWALNLPVEIGGGGIPFMPYVYVNEIIGRSEHAMAALGTHVSIVSDRPSRRSAG